MGTPAFVVISKFKVKPGMVPAFLDAALDDARHSVADETGCRQFDVVCPEGSQDTVVFYEVYDSRAAFEAHLETPADPLACHILGSRSAKSSPIPDAPEPLFAPQTRPFNGTSATIGR